MSELGEGITGERQEKSCQFRNHCGSFCCLFCRSAWQGSISCPCRAGGWCQILMNELLCLYRGRWMAAVPLSREAAELCWQSASSFFMTRRTNKEDCTYSGGLRPIRLRKSEGKKASCCMTGRKKPIPAYFWQWCSVTSHLRILGTEILSSLQ